MDRRRPRYEHIDNVPSSSTSDKAPSNSTLKSMRSPYELPRVGVRPARPEAADADLLIIPVAQDHTADAVTAFDDTVGGELASALQRGEFQAKPNQTFVCRVVGSGWPTRRIVFVGAGPRAELGAERFRRIAARAGRLAAEQRLLRGTWLAS